MNKIQRRIYEKEWALLPLRLIIGFGFAAHGYAKLSRGPASFAAILDALGVPLPHLMAWVTAIVELVGGVSVMAGAFTLPLTLPLTVIMMTAMFSVHLRYGYSSIRLEAVTTSGAEFGPIGYELNLLYIAGLLALALSGPTRLSLDHWFRSRKKEFPVQETESAGQTMQPEASYSIIHARPRDLPHIGAIELAAASLLKDHAPETVLNEVTGAEELLAAQREGRLWVALAGNTPVGFAHVKILQPGSAHLDEIDVYPKHGRRGLGTGLIAEVCKWARKHGYEEITLTTFRDVPWNMPFYLRLGFEEVPPELITPAMRSVLNDELRRGLDPTRRVVMRCRF